MFLAELDHPQLLVIYPGRFQPFHKGHYAVYEWLSSKFGRNSVYIATSNKTDSVKSPFSFAEKSYFMQLTGVPADRIIQASQPYQIESIMSTGQITVHDTKNTVVIFAVSQKDMAEDPRFKSWSKKDGSPAYFQPLPKDIAQTADMTQHGYILTVPTFDFEVLGHPMRSGTELRNLYSSSDEKTRQAIIKDLFGRYTQEAEQILNNKLPAPQTVAEDSKIDPKIRQLQFRANLAHPNAKNTDQALALYILDKEQHDIGDVEQEEHSTEDKLKALYKEITALHQEVDTIKKNTTPLKEDYAYSNIKHAYMNAQQLGKKVIKTFGGNYKIVDISHPDAGLAPNTEFLTAQRELIKKINQVTQGIAAARDLHQWKSPEIQKLLADRSRLYKELTHLRKNNKSYIEIPEAAGVGVVRNTKDPRYSMSTTQDVTGDTLGKEMQALGLVGRRNPGQATQQKKVKRSVGKGRGA